MPTSCLGLYTIMNYVCRACTAFSGGGFLKFFWSVCFLFFIFQFWSGPVPGSQLLKPVDISKARGLLGPYPRAPLQWTTDLQEKGNRSGWCLFLESRNDITASAYDFGKPVCGPGFTAQEGRTLVNRPHH